MEEKIKLVIQNDEAGSINYLNKLQIEQKILEVLETKEVVSVEIKYKKEPVHCECTNSKLNRR